MRKFPNLPAALLLASALCVAQTRPIQAHQPPPPPTKSAPVKQSMQPDSQVEALIRAKFAKSKINADKFTVHVQGGVATLEGRTDIVQHKATATRLAKTGGAIAVNNHIQISDAAKKKAADNLEQGRRRAQVKRGDARSDPRAGK